jgi:hypothetical protein
LRLTIDKEFSGKIEKLKNLLSHSRPNASTKDILEMAIDLLLSKKDPERKVKNYNAPLPPAAGGGGAEPSRYISSHIRKLVWTKSKGQRCYCDPNTGRICGAKKFLHIDHISPIFKRWP